MTLMIFEVLNCIAHTFWGEMTKKDDHDAQSWALSVFFKFFNNENEFFALFKKLISYFSTNPI